MIALWLALALAQAPQRAPAPPEPTLAELEALGRGEVVVREELGEAGSSGLSMLEVDASPEQVWSVILDFDGYVRFLPYVTASWAEQPPAGSPEDSLRWGMELTTKGVVTRYQVDCELDRESGLMRWVMQPVGYSPMSQARGHWWVLPTQGGRTLLAYGVDVDTAWWVPPWVHRKAADRGLPGIVALVGKRAASQAAFAED